MTQLRLEKKKKKRWENSLFPAALRNAIMAAIAWRILYPGA